MVETYGSVFFMTGHFHPSLTLACKASFQSLGALLEKAHVLLANIKLGWKWQKHQACLAYNTATLITIIK